MTMNTARQNTLGTSVCDRTRGSVMVMVVVVLVLLAMLGAAYLQMARVQRIAPSQPIDNIDLVLQSIIDEIARQLAEDVRHDGTNFFVPGTAAEPFDYPRTNAAVDRDVPTLSGSMPGAKGGINDDTWLGDAFPYLNSGTLTWRKLTSLTGGHYANSGNNVAAAASGENPTIFVTTDYDNIAVNNAQLVDASGDGIGDSRWERAPLMVLTGAEYFMAVRVMDASALMNLRAGTRLTDDGTNIPATPAFLARGYVPNDADLSRFAARRHGAWATELAALFADATVRGRAINGAIPTTVADRLDLWLNSPPPAGTSVHGQLAGYGITQVIPFHWRGGLKDAALPSPYDTHLTNLLASPYDNNSATPIANATDHFLGGTAALVSGRSFPSIRHMVTGLSGRAAFAPNHGGMHGGAHRLQQCLVYENAGNPQAQANAFQQRLAVIFDRDAGYTADPELASMELALAVQAYMDPSNTIETQFSHGGETYYPIKRLPFLREAYFQVAYEDTDKYDDVGAENPDNVWETWIAKAGTQGVVIELGNPFDKTIAAADLNNRVRVVIVQNNADVATYTFAGAADLASRRNLILRSNPSTASTEPGFTGDIEAALFSSPGADFTVMPLANGALTFNVNGDPITVELRVNIGGDWRTYDRLTDDNLRLDLEVTHQEHTAPANDTHGQMSVYRDGRVIRYLTNVGRVLDKRTPRNDTTTPSTYSTSESKIGNNTKVAAFGAPGTHALDRFQIPIANRPMFSVTEMAQVIAFGFSTADEGDFPQRLDSIAPAGRFLDFSSGAPTFNDGNGRNIKYAAAVLDQFSTISPRWDGINNETGAAGNANEDQFIFGTMNINTAPLHLATLASPLPYDLNTTQTVMNDILVERLNRHGFTSIGELMDVPAINTDPGTTMGVGTAFDLYPTPEDVPAIATRYDTDQTGEERVQVMQFLPQVFSTRSDIYIAHILAKGYLSGDFGSGAVEQGRMLVVFSRAKLVGGGGGQVEILGAYKY
jgi:hypothetical protein